MTLFQILTRYVAVGKIKVTRKLLNRVRRHTTGKRHSKPPEPRRKKFRGVRHSCCAALATIFTLPIWLVTGYVATAAEPTASDIATSTYSAVALFNQGNAYARDGKSGLAILNYERAQLLAPNDADIAANLHFVRAKAALPDVSGNWLTRSLTYIRPNTMAWLGGLGLVLAGLGIVLARLNSRRRLAFRFVTLAGALLVAGAIGSAITMWPRVSQAVVVVGEAPVRTSPVRAAESIFKLREGETVTVCAEHQDFALVKTAAGRSGWVELGDLTRVVPPSGNPVPSPNRT